MSDDRPIKIFQEKIPIPPGEQVSVTLPEPVESPEIELLGELEENGVTFPSWPLAVAIVSRWMEKHCDSPRGPEQASDAALLKTIIAGGKKAGLVAHCLAFDSGLTPYETSAELAKALGVPPSRISEIRKALHHETH